jgi:nucleoside-diphosphate-sugar epimerase
MNHTILITGGTGYIGGKLVNALVRGNYKVIILSRQRNNRKFMVLEDNITQLYYDKYEEILDIFSTHSPSIVIHLAAFQPKNISSTVFRELIDTNLLFGLYVAEAAAKYNCKGFIYASSYSQSLNGKGYTPLNLYSASKQAFEDFLKYYAISNKLRVISLRLFDVYGPDDSREKLINYIVSSIKSNHVIHLTKGQQYLDLVHIDDVVCSFFSAIKILDESITTTFSIYDVASKRRITIIELVKIIEKIISKKIDVIFGSRVYREFEPFNVDYSYNILPGWKTNIELEFGLEKIIKITN